MKIENWKLAFSRITKKLKHEGKGIKACFQSPTKHEAQPKQACLISVACRLAKCRSDWKEQELLKARVFAKLSAERSEDENWKLKIENRKLAFGKYMKKLEIYFLYLLDY